MNHEIHFYGERGLINALFLDLRSKAKTAEFLRKIEFAFRDPPHLDIPDSSEIVVIVEGSFAGFGWPDAILVAKIPDGRRLVFFLEAKVGLYINEAQDYAKRESGFNSSINGQFTLRYRLVRTLREHGGAQSRLVEPESLALAYGEQSASKRLAKSENLKHIVRPHLLGASDYFFVALTDDTVNIWQSLEDENPELLPFLAEPLPLGSASPGSEWNMDRNAWRNHRVNFGWVGFRDIETLVGDGEFFCHARPFLDAKRRLPRSSTGVQNIRTRNWNKFPQSGRTIRLRDRLRTIIVEEIRDSDLTYKKGNGSDSLVGSGHQRLLKLIPPVPPHDHADILLGVREGTTGFPEELRKRSQVIGIQGRGFEIIEISEDDFSEGKVKELIQDTIANIMDYSVENKR